MLSTQDASDRYIIKTTNQGTVGNWIIRAQNPTSLDLYSGNTVIENTLTVASAYEATGFGFGSFSTRGGIDCLLSVYAGKNGTFLQDLIAGRDASIGRNLSIVAAMTAVSASLSGTASDTLKILNGGIVANTIQANTSLTSVSSSLLQGTTQVMGPFSITTTTQSTSPSSGSMTSLGGIGVAGNIYSGSNINSAQNITAAATVQATNGVLIGLTEATSQVAGTLSCSGGGTISKSLYVGKDFFTGGSTTSAYRFLVKSSTNEIDILPDGTNSVLHANNSNITFGSTLASVIFANAANATGFADGSIQILGGGSIQKDLYVKGGLFLNGPVQGTNSVLFSNNTASTAANNGAVVVLGGLGVNHINCSSGIIAGSGSVMSATNTTTGNLQSKGGLGVVGDAYIGATLNVLGMSSFAGFVSTNPSSVSNTFSVTGASTFGITHITDATVPTSYSTAAALLVDGGIVAKNASYIQSTLQLASTLTLDYNSSNTGQILLNSPTASSVGRIGFNSTFQSLAVVSPTTYSINLVSDAGLNYKDGTGVNAVVRFSATTNRTTVNNTVDCTALGTAGLVTNSGLSVALSTIIGQTLAVQSTSDNAFVLSGGANIAKSVVIGNNINVSNNSTIGGNLSVVGNTSLTGMVNLFAALSSTSMGSFAGALIAGGAISAQSVANSSWGGPSSSTSPTGSLISYGGGVVEKDFFVGGNQNVFGNSLLQGSVNINGVTHITSTVTSSSPSNQALVVDGGASINRGLIVSGPIVNFGDVFVTGKLTVQGSRTNIQSTTVTNTDNIIAVNTGTRNLPDAGMSFGRDQEANNTGGGFIMTDTPAYTMTVQNSVSDNLTIQLPSSASNVDNFYQNYWVKIISGTGANQVRFVDASSGTNQTLTIRSTAQQNQYNIDNPPPSGGVNATIGLDFATPPDSTSTIALFNTNVGVFLQQQLQSGSEYRLGYTTVDPVTSISNVPLTKLALLRLAVLAASQNVQADNYLPYTPGNSILLNTSVSIDPSGNINGVKKINGAPGPMTFNTITVSETANGATGGTVIPITATFGVIKYTITSPDGTGSTASGEITTNQASTSFNYGTPNTAVTALPGMLGEQVGIMWTYNSPPVLTLFKSRDVGSQTGTPIPFKLTIILQ